MGEASWEEVSAFLQRHFPGFGPQEIRVCARCDRAFGVRGATTNCPNCGQGRLTLQEALTGHGDAKAAFVRAYQRIQERLAAIPE